MVVELVLKVTLNIPSSPLIAQASMPATYVITFSIFEIAIVWITSSKGQSIPIVFQSVVEVHIRKVYIRSVVFALA